MQIIELCSYQDDKWLNTLLVVDQVVAWVHAERVPPLLLVIERAGMFESALFPCASLLLIEVIAQSQVFQC